MRNTIEPRQELLDDLYVSKKPRKERAAARPVTNKTGIAGDDRMLLDIALHAKNGAKFSALWQGDTSGYPSQSEADQALCCILAFYAGDNPDRIDHLFRQSGLYREDRWDSPARTGETYGQGTIARAIEGLTAVYGGPSQRQEDFAYSVNEDASKEQVTAYRYALNLTDERIDDLSHEELKQACKEMNTLLHGLLSLTYAKGAKPTTRLAGQDLLITSARRTTRGLSTCVTDAMPVCISNDDYGVAARLGLGRNSVSSAYNAYEQAGLLNRSYRESEDGETQHLDIALAPSFLTNGSQIQDKKSYDTRTVIFKSVPVEKHCSTCGSENVTTICRECGTIEELGAQPTTETVEEEPVVESKGAEKQEDEDPCTKIVQSYSACDLTDCTKFVQSHPQEIIADQPDKKECDRVVVTEQHSFQVDEVITYRKEKLTIFKVSPQWILAERSQNKDKSIVRIDAEDFVAIKRKRHKDVVQDGSS